MNRAWRSRDQVGYARDGNPMTAHRIPAAAGLAMAVLASPGAAQTRKPTAQETKLVRDCVDSKEGARQEQCIGLVSTRCMRKPENQAGLNRADCYRIEQEVWDVVLHESYKALRGELDEEQKAEGARHAARLDRLARGDLRVLASQDPGLGVGADDGVLHAPETARRALLLATFGGL